MHRFERRFTIGLIVITTTLFGWMIYYHWAVLAPAAGGLRAPDFVPWGYTAQEVRDWVDAMDESQIERFIGRHTLTYDLVFPFLLSWTLYRLFSVVMARFERFRAMPSILRVLFALVMVLPYLFFDMAENLAVLRALTEPMMPVARLSTVGALTLAKYVFVTIALIVLGAMQLAAGHRRASYSS